MNVFTTNLQNAKDYSASINSTSNIVVPPFMDTTFKQNNNSSNQLQSHNESRQLNKNYHQTNQEQKQEQQENSTSFANSYLNCRFSSSSSSSGSCFSVNGDSSKQLRNVINQSNHYTASKHHTNNRAAPIASIHRLSSASSNGSLNYYNRSSNSNRNSNNHKSHHSTASSFANNMIAKLSAGGSLTARQAPSQNSAQSKRKRSKLLDILLNSNWSKQNQQASNIMKLNKILLVCDANFLDEKTGESPISLAISSSQINNLNSTSTSNHAISSSMLLTNTSLATSHFGSLTVTATATTTASTNPIISCPPQSASLFNLTAQSIGKGPITRHTLQQTNISDLSQSKAPLIERILLLLVKSGAQIDFRNSDGKTPLHIAAMKSNFWALKTLLELEASTDYRDINGLTPLYYSILHKADLKVTQLLLNYQNRNLSNFAGVAQTNYSIQASQSNRQPAIGITDQHGWQEVHQACKLGLDAHLEKLLYYGCDINGKISGSGNTPLHVAAINDQLNCAKVLLMRGADKTITNNSHQTAHQVAVISNNMDLAEFIAEHNESKVIPFRERPANFVDMSCRSSFSMASPSLSSSTPPTTTAANTNVATISQRSSTRSSSLANSHSWVSNTSSNQPRATVLPQLQQAQHMNPLSLDVPTQGTNTSAADSSNGSSGCQPQSLLSISSNQQQQSHNHLHQLNVQVNNISPCLSQRSCATSNTTSSSGVCCDGDGNNSAEELQQSKLSNSLSQHSNITIIAINKNDKSQSVSTNGRTTIDGIIVNDENEEDEDLRSSGSSSNDLYSLMSEERPLFAGTIVEATSDYQSGDPNHLRLKRGDLIEVLEYTQELLQGGQLPRLANKPMLYGRRKSDGLCGLFPSFCVHRAKHQKNFGVSQRSPLTDIANPSNIINNSNMPTTMVGLQNGGIVAQNIRGRNLPESNSMATLNNQQTTDITSSDDPFNLKSKFREIQVTLTKTNEGFGFVLRGAKVDPSTFTANGCQKNKVIIDEKLMAANNLVSLQYLDEIEPDSVASRAGLNRGDFLVAVNHQDVRLTSHEQVVQMIRQSGHQVHFTIATPLVNAQMNQQQTTNNMSKTLGRVKPEPPKRDPTTTLTRNRAQKVRLMLIQPLLQQQQQQNSEQFDANKPLPVAPSTQSPMSPTGSLNMMNRSISTNLSHFDSAQSLSSATNTQSISSASTIGVDEQAQQQQQQQNQSEQPTPTHSSSSTATLTTVAATSIKPKAPPKPAVAQIGQFGNQSTGVHQSAVIQTTTRRISQPGNQQENSSPTSSNATITPPSPQASSFTQPPPPPPLSPPTVPSALLAPVASVMQQEVKQTNLLSGLPPPPPPLPDFSASPTGVRVNQRRTSAPIIQTLPVSVDNNRLLRKRESLAIVNQVDRAQAPVPAEFGAVAAACAAAANNRLQRQQRQKQEENENGKIEQEVANNPKNEIMTNVTKGPEERKAESKLSETIKSEHCVKADDIAQGPQNVVSKESSPLVESSVGSQHQSTRPLDRKQMSATLGRKSSAQIIQQPKTQQSQTLRGSRPKRASILNYDELPPPPPPLPVADETALYIGANESYQSTKLTSTHHQQPLQQQQQHHHHHHHNHHLTEIPTLKHEYNQQQQQMQSLTLHQQQVIKQQQQLRQQQLLQQQQQQQLLLQQQVQLQQRMCLGGKHGHDHYGHVGHFVDSSSKPTRGHHLHESHHQQPIIQQQIKASQAIPQHQHQHHHHHQQQQQQQSHHRNYHSHHPHHNHSHHEKLMTGVAQQEYHQHQHHHHHHHHQQQQQHQYQTTPNNMAHKPEINHQQPTVQSAVAGMHNHNHNYLANQSQQQQQQLYQRLQQQQQLAERYLPLVYAADAYTSAARDS